MSFKSLFKKFKGLFVPFNFQRLTDKAKNHPLSFWTMLLGSLLTIFLFIIWLVPLNDNQKVEKRIEIKKIEVSSRTPVWDNDAFNQDEIVVKISATSTNPSINKEFSIVPFWRLANSFETNWHVGKRRVGSNYKLALLEANYTFNDEWQFLFGGIESNKKYNGDIVLVLVAFPNEFINKKKTEWMQDNHGWGIEKLPLDSSLTVSNIQTFNTTTVR